MNTITMKVELCAEDRARLDRIFEALTTNVAGYVVSQVEKYNAEKQAEPAATVNTEPIEAPQTTENTTPEEKPVEAKEMAVAEPAVEVTRADIQRKVVELSSSGKKDQVREIVKKYADKVSTIPEEKLPEVWNKLTALEG